MKRISFLLAFGLVASLAMAQSTNNLKLRVGGIYPLENQTRKITGNMIGVGVEFKFPKSLLPNGETFLNIDWFGKSAGGAKGNMFPIMLNQRFFPDPKQDVGNRTYFFLGAGFVNMDVTTAKTVYGGRAGLGKELSDKLSFEATLTVSTDANKAKANSIGLYLGYQF